MVERGNGFRKATERLGQRVEPIAPWLAVTAWIIIFNRKTGKFLGVRTGAPRKEGKIRAGGRRHKVAGADYTYATDQDAHGVANVDGIDHRVNDLGGPIPLGETGLEAEYSPINKRRWT